MLNRLPNNKNYIRSKTSLIIIYTAIRLISTLFSFYLQIYYFKVICILLKLKNLEKFNTGYKIKMAIDYLLYILSPIIYI